MKPKKYKKKKIPSDLKIMPGPSYTPSVEVINKLAAKLKDQEKEEKNNTTTPYLDSLSYAKWVHGPGKELYFNNNPSGPRKEFEKKLGGERQYLSAYKLYKYQNCIYNILNVVEQVAKEAHERELANKDREIERLKSLLGKYRGNTMRGGA